MIWIVNDALEVVSATLWQLRKELKINLKQNQVQQIRPSETKKSGLKVVTLIATLNPVSQVLW